MHPARARASAPAPAPLLRKLQQSLFCSRSPSAASPSSTPLTPRPDPTKPRAPTTHNNRAAAVEVTTEEVAAADAAAAAASSSSSADDYAGLSYSAQYDKLFGQYKAAGAPLPIKQMIAKPDPDAQAKEPGATKVLASSVYATQKVPLWRRSWNSTDWTYVGFMAVLHGLCLLAPMTFSWANVALFFGTYFVTGCLGITLSFHRQLSHRSFTTPKWLEYALAYCGVLAVQGDPMEWVSSHRYHHLHTDTPLDPHSPYEGFWWSHMGWLLDNQVRGRDEWVMSGW